MDAFTRRDLRELVDEQGFPCLSLFMPTHRGGEDTRQNPIRFRNLVRQAEQTLVDHGLRKAEIERFMMPVWDLELDGLFWGNQADGLAMFRSNAKFHRYRLELDFPEAVDVQDRFHILPLTPLVAENAYFYVLALSQNKPRLLICTRGRAKETEIGGMPRGIADTLRFDDPEKSLQFHTQTPQPGRRAAVFHGQGTGVDESKTNLLRYCQDVGKAVAAALEGETAPLVPAGVEYELAIYREANTYPHLTAVELFGSPDEIDPQTLGKRAHALLEPYFQARAAAAVERAKSAQPSGRAVDQLDGVISAAAGGRVRELLVGKGEHRWGRWDSEHNHASIHEHRQPGDDELLDYAAFETLRHGGAVYTVPHGILSSASPVAAVLRY